MFTLVTENGKYFKVKRGQSAEEVQSALNVPVLGEAFCGRIIETDKRYKVYTATAGDNYRTVAERFGVTEAELRQANGGKPVFPTCKLFVP